MCGCKVKKNKWVRHVKTEKHRKGVEGVMEKLMGIWWGQRVGRSDQQRYIHLYTYINIFYLCTGYKIY